MITRDFEGKIIAGFEHKDFTGWDIFDHGVCTKIRSWFIEENGIEIYFSCIDNDRYIYNLNGLTVQNIMTDGKTLTFYLDIGTLTCPIQKEEKK